MIQNHAPRAQQIGLPRHELGERTLNGLTINGTASNSSLSLPLNVVQFDQLLDRCRILRLLVSFPEGDQPRKAQRITRLSPNFACGMSRRARDLVGQYLKDE